MSAILLIGETNVPAEIVMNEWPAPPMPEAFHQSLQSGSMLCHFLNTLIPTAIPEILEGEDDVNRIRNIAAFFDAVESIGVEEKVTLTDLIEAPPRVVQFIIRIAQHIGLEGEEGEIRVPKGGSEIGLPCLHLTMPLMPHVSRPAIVHVEEDDKSIVADLKERVKELEASLQLAESALLKSRETISEIQESSQVQRRQMNDEKEQERGDWNDRIGLMKDEYEEKMKALKLKHDEEIVRVEEKSVADLNLKEAEKKEALDGIEREKKESDQIREQWKEEKEEWEEKERELMKKVMVEEKQVQVEEKVEETEDAIVQTEEAKEDCVIMITTGTAPEHTAVEDESTQTGEQRMIYPESKEWSPGSKGVVQISASTFSDGVASGPGRIVKGEIRSRSLSPSRQQQRKPQTPKGPWYPGQPWLRRSPPLPAPLPAPTTTPPRFGPGSSQKMIASSNDKKYTKEGGASAAAALVARRLVEGVS